MRRGILIVAMVLGPALGAKAQTTCSGSIVPNANCVVIPPPNPNFQPVLEWAWTNPPPGDAFPNHIHVAMTPVVADLDPTDGDDVPQVIFTSYINWDPQPVIRVVSGRDGTLIRTISLLSDPNGISFDAGLAVGDITGDGRLEIVALTAGPSNTTDGVVVFDNMGIPLPGWPWYAPPGLWDSAGNPDGTGGVLITGAPAIADLDTDGTPEIIVGNVVLDSTGTPLPGWPAMNPSGPGGQQVFFDNNKRVPISFAADIDVDGTLEIVNGGTVYNADGTKRWVGRDANNTPGSELIRNGFSAVGNFDTTDERAEVVVVWAEVGVPMGHVTLLDDNGDHLSTVDVPGVSPGDAVGGPPTIADFDNDGRPEIGVAGATMYAVFDVNPSTLALSVLWSATIDDNSSNFTGSSVFDFDGDGQAEVVYSDECDLWIFDGATGTVRAQVQWVSSQTRLENPVIADVDNDCNAEIVVCANTRGNTGCDPSSNRTHGIFVYEDANDAWVNTRSIWNQHAYSITNVNDDGSIPTYIQPNWLGGGPPDDPTPNTFRANSRGSVDCPVFAAPDLTVLSIEGACDASGDFVLLTATIGNNAMPAGVAAGVQVAFYDGDPQSGGTLITPASGETNPVETTESIGPLGSIVVSLTASLPNGVIDVFVCADDDGNGTGAVAECDETNNCCSAELTVDCPCAFPPAEMISWWPLDEPTGTKAADIVRGNDGTHVGPLVRDSELVNGSLVFNGIDTYVEVPDPADGSLDFGASTGNGAGDFSIDAWIRPSACACDADLDGDGDVDDDDFLIFADCWGAGCLLPWRSECGPADLDCSGCVDQNDLLIFQCQYNGSGGPPVLDCCPPGSGELTGTRPIVDKFGACAWPPRGNEFDPNATGYSFQLQDDRLALGLADGCSIQNLTFFLSDPIPQLGDGQWHHVAVTVDRDVSNNGIKFYVDGALHVPSTNLDPTGESGSLENFWFFMVGLAAYSSPPEYFLGNIDEVEIFGRVLGQDDIAKIYRANDLGKCKDRCSVPAVKSLCPNDDFVSVPVTVCNDSTEPHEYSVYAVNGLPTGNGCTVDGLTGFGPLAPLEILPGDCQPIDIVIPRPSTMPPGSGEVACYEVVILNLDTGYKFRCTGKIRDGSMVCGPVPDGDPVSCCTVGGVPGFGVPVGFPVLNVSGSAEVFDYEIAVQACACSGASGNDVVSLDGLGPGTNVAGSLSLGPGESQTIGVSVEFLAHSPFRFYDILLLVDTDGDGVKEPIDAIGAWSVLPPSCPEAADFDGDTDVDAADFAVFQAAFGHSEGDPAYNAAADYDGDGTVSLLDYQVWLDCYRQFVGNPTAPPPTLVPGDFDFDGDVDMADFLTFSNCFNGSLNPPAPGCEAPSADLDADGDVDGNDFLTFSNCFNGAMNPPRCP